MCPAACAAVCGSGLTRRAVKGSCEAFDPLAGHPVLRCVKPGLAETLSCIGPHPVEFVHRGDGDLVLRIEAGAPGARRIQRWLGRTSRCTEFDVPPSGGGLKT